jgi:hypothetical protein
MNESSCPIIYVQIGIKRLLIDGEWKRDDLLQRRHYSKLSLWLDSEEVIAVLPGDLTRRMGL